MVLKTFTISEFKAHCTEILRQVEESGMQVEVTRHGKKVAQITPPDRPVPLETLGAWMGKGAGVAYSSAYDPDAPACAPEEWEAEQI